MTTSKLPAGWGFLVVAAIGILLMIKMILYP